MSRKEELEDKIKRIEEEIDELLNQKFEAQAELAEIESYEYLESQGVNY